MDFGIIPTSEIPYMRDALGRAMKLSAIVDGDEKIEGYSNRNHGIVFIRNNPGGPINVGHAVTLGDPEETTADALNGNIVFKSATFDPDTFVVVAQSFIDVDKFGPAVICGTAKVTVNVLAAGDQFCVASSQTAFESIDEDDITSDDVVYRIVWKESGTGELEAVILLPPIKSGGSGSIVMFSIDSAIAETPSQNDQPGEQGVATCTPRYQLCGGSIPGRDDEGKIAVYDPMGCLFDENEEDLVDRWGYAAWMKPTPEEATRIGESYPECRWVALGLCCSDSTTPE
jgi:hypothetical protein